MGLDGINRVLAQMNREVWLLTAADGPRRGGLVATFVSQASIVAELPRVVAGIGCRHHTHRLIDASGAFALHLLGEQHLDWVRRFGTQSGRNLDKLAGLPFRSGATGSPILDGALGWLECRVEARLPTGDRTLYLAEVVDGELDSSSPPLRSQRLLELAPPDLLQTMKEQYLADSRGDAAAIYAWRRANRGP